MELVSDVGRETMPRAKAVLADLRKRERVPSRAAEDQRGALGPRLELP